MNPETLERLMLDRGLGALPSDCEELLAAYLELRPEAAVMDREIGQTVEMARKAMTVAPSSALPAFPVDRLTRAARAHRNQNVLRNVLALAACLLLGFGLHALWFKAEARVSKPPSRAFVTNTGTGSRTASEQPESSFWSGRRLYERAAGATRQPSPRVIWHSPAAWPRIGDAT